MSVNYIELVGTYYPSYEVSTNPGGDPSNYADVQWKTLPAIPKSTLDQLDPAPTYGQRGTIAVTTDVSSQTEGSVLTFTNGQWSGINKSWNVGKVKNIWTVSIPARTGTTTFPTTATPPLITSGTEIWTQTVTAAKATNKFKISFAVTVDASVAAAAVPIALFRNNVCIATVVTGIPVKTYSSAVPSIITFDAPATTGPVVYSARVGIAFLAGTWYINMAARSTTLYSTTMAAMPCIIEEYEA